MQADQSHSRLFASGSPRKTSGVVLFDLKTWESGTLICEARRRQMSKLKERANSHLRGLFVLFKPTMDWLGDAHTHWWLWYSLLSLMIQMLMSFRNPLTGTPRNTLQVVWESLSSVKFTPSQHCVAQGKNSLYLLQEYIEIMS